MLNRAPRILLLACCALSLAVNIIMILYSKGISLTSHIQQDTYQERSSHIQEDTYQERYLMDKVQDSPGKLTNMKSGSSTIYVNQFGRVAIPPAKTLESMHIEELEETIFRYIENIQTPCTRMFHMGNEMDGGYHVCETYLKPGNCLVYSFGIHKDFSFDDAVSKTYGCKVHSFDPGDGQKDHKRSDKVTFHCIGIGAEDKNIMVNNVNWKIMTFDSIKGMLGHTGRQLDIVKIDTETAEWDSLENMIETGVIKDINILIIEFHVWLRYKEKLEICRTPERYKRYLTIIRGLYEYGFRTYYFRMWPDCHYEINGIGRTACHEVHFVNIDRERFD